jgi:hypothetical protein
LLLHKFWSSETRFLRRPMTQPSLFAPGRPPRSTARVPGLQLHGANVALVVELARSNIFSRNVQQLAPAAGWSRRERAMQPYKLHLRTMNDGICALRSSTAAVTGGFGRGAARRCPPAAGSRRCSFRQARGAGRVCPRPHGANAGDLFSLDRVRERAGANAEHGAEKDRHVATGGLCRKRRLGGDAWQQGGRFRRAPGMRRAAQQPEVGSGPKPNTKIDGRRDAHANPPPWTSPLRDPLMAPKRWRDFSGPCGAHQFVGRGQCALGGLGQYLSRQ